MTGLLALLLAQAPMFSQAALDTEQQLALDQPWGQAQLIGAHNAYNNQGDPAWQNQFWSLTELLDHGVSVLELDLHWQPRPDGSWRVRVCHGLGAQDCLLNAAGSRDYSELLEEVRIWLGRHPRRFVILELENHVDDAQAVLGPLKKFFGSWIYTAAERASGWRDETPRQLLARGKRLIVADFGPLRFDGRLIWDENLWFSNATSRHFTPDCRYQGREMAGGRWGFYDDKTLHFNGLPPIAAAQIQAYLACDVRYLKLDRIDAAVLGAAQYSWATAPPAGRSCAHMQQNDFHWLAGSCEQALPSACYDARANRWRLTATAELQSAASLACQRAFGPSYTFGVPRSFRQNLDLWQLLRTQPAGTQIQLNHRQTED